MNLLPVTVTFRGTTINLYVDMDETPYASPYLANSQPARIVRDEKGNVHMGLWRHGKTGVKLHACGFSLTENLCVVSVAPHNFGSKGKASYKYLQSI